MIFDSLYQGIMMFSGGLRTLTAYCIRGIQVNENVCRQEGSRSVGLATALCPKIGYNAACSLACEALHTQKTVRELAHSRGLLTDSELDALLDPVVMTEIRN